MPFKKAGADILPLIERGGGANKQSLAGYKIGGVALADAVTTTAAGAYLYSGETYTPTGYKKGGGQIVFQSAGCRPRTDSAIWQSGGAGTAYINRFTDGEVWVSSTTNSRTGAKISNSYDSGVYPRGIKHLIVRLWGGGGQGGRGGLLATYGTGGAAAAGVVCIKLPTEGNVKIVVGKGGNRSQSASETHGEDGVSSSVTCGSFWATAGFGQGAEGGGSSGHGSGGTWSSSGNNADGVVVKSTNGASQSTSNTSVSYADYAPEGGSYSFSGGAGGSKGGSGYGTGGAGGTGDIVMFY